MSRNKLAKNHQKKVRFRSILKVAVPLQFKSKHFLCQCGDQSAGARERLM